MPTNKLTIEKINITGVSIFVRVINIYPTIGFNGAKTNCGIAHILGILLMNSCDTVIILATTIICSLFTLNTHLFNSIYLFSEEASYFCD